MLEIRWRANHIGPRTHGTYYLRYEEVGVDTTNMCDSCENVTIASQKIDPLAIRALGKASRRKGHLSYHLKDG